MQISQFILQIIQHPLRFTALGFFYLGNSFIQKVSFHLYIIFYTFKIFILHIINYKIYNYL